MLEYRNLILVFYPNEYIHIYIQAKEKWYGQVLARMVIHPKGTGKWNESVMNLTIYIRFYRICTKTWWYLFAATWFIAKGRTGRTVLCGVTGYGRGVKSCRAYRRFLCFVRLRLGCASCFSPTIVLGTINAVMSPVVKGCAYHYGKPNG